MANVRATVSVHDEAGKEPEVQRETPTPIGQTQVTYGPPTDLGPGTYRIDLRSLMVAGLNFLLVGVLIFTIKEKQ